MDSEEFNRAVTQKEIERSRWIGEERERRTYNRESNKDLLEKGIVIAGPDQKLLDKYGVPKEDLRLLSDLGVEVNKFKTKEINGEILLEDSIGNRIRIDKSGNITYGLGRTSDLISLDSNGLRETYKEYITSQMVVDKYVKLKAKYGKDSQEWEAIDKILENRSELVSLGTAFPIANAKAWMNGYWGLPGIVKSFSTSAGYKTLSRIPVKSGFFERLFTRKVPTSSLIPNPGDEFTTIGASDSAISKYKKEIARTKTISEPIMVRKMSDGTYEIINGHHRWQAAQDMNLKNVPIKIIE